MGGMQRRKGAVGEREVVQRMLAKGILCHRTAQRMGRAGDAADVRADGMDMHIEVKRTERLRWGPTIAQVTRDAHGKPWVIMHRHNGGGWFVIQPLDQWIEDSKEAQRGREHRAGIVAQVTETIQAPHCRQAIRTQGEAMHGSKVDEPQGEVDQDVPRVQ